MNEFKLLLPVLGLMNRNDNFWFPGFLETYTIRMFLTSGCEQLMLDKDIVKHHAHSVTMQRVSFCWPQGCRTVRIDGGFGRYSLLVFGYVCLMAWDFWWTIHHCHCQITLQFLMVDSYCSPLGRQASTPDESDYDYKFTNKKLGLVQFIGPGIRS